MKRTIMLVVLSAMLLLGPAATAAQAHPSTFTDVAETNPAHEAIESLSAAGIMPGVTPTRFQPRSPVSRGLAVETLVRSSGTQLTGSAVPFSDVSQRLRPFIAVALAQGWISGYSDGTFRPGLTLTRQQAAILLVRSLGWQEQAQALSASQINQALRQFADRYTVSPGARPYVALCVLRGLINGVGGNLRPFNPVTRAQFSLLVFRATSLGSSRSLETATTSQSSDATEMQSTGASDQTKAAAPVEQQLSPEELGLAQFMDTYLFAPHNSPITGRMVLENTRRFGIPALPQLVIMAAETSLGDPQLGGALARYNNFGCLRYHGATTPWGLLSSGRIWVAGRDWYAFPTPESGMLAFGKYLKWGANGFYQAILTAGRPNWAKFASVYYGQGVSGYSSYVSRLYAIEARFRTKAAEQGLSF